MSIVRKAADHEDLWSRKALLYVNLSIQLGYESKKKRAQMFQGPVPAATAASSSDAPGDSKPTIMQ
eukprot:5658298-Heterocapsa_arctica.AAC.1